MSSNVVGRAVVQIDGKLDTQSIAKTADQIETVFAEAGADAAAAFETNVSAIGDAADGVATEVEGRFAGLQTSVSDVGGGFGDLATGLTNLGIAEAGFAAGAVKTFEAVEGGTQIVQGLSATVGPAIGLFKSLGGVTRLVTIGQAALNAVLALNPITLVVIAIAALVAALVVAYQKSETFRRIVDAAFRAIREVVVTVIDTVRNVIATAWEFIVGLTTTLSETLGRVWSNIRDAISRAVTTVSDTVTGVFERLSSTVEGIIDGLWSAVTGAFTTARDTVTRVVNTVRDNVTDALETARDNVTAVIDNIIDTVTGLPGQIAGLAGDMLQAGLDFVGGLFEGIGRALSSAGSIATDIAADIGRALKDLINRQVIDRINDNLEFRIGPPGFGVDINPPDIPHLQSGGIVTRPTLAVIGEAGPEAVVPLTPGRAGAAGVTVVNNFYRPVSAAEVARETQWALRWAPSGAPA